MCGLLGWQSTHPIFPANYGCSSSRSHATPTPTTDYARVSEAAGLPAPAECHIVSFLFLYAERTEDEASDKEAAPTFSINISVSDGSVSSKWLMFPPCCRAASTITLGLRLA